MRGNGWETGRQHSVKVGVVLGVAKPNLVALVLGVADCTLQLQDAVGMQGSTQDAREHRCELSMSWWQSWGPPNLLQLLCRPEVTPEHPEYINK